jgi:hypothetical protein
MTLTGKYIPVIKTRRIRPKVPFAYHGSLVTNILEKLRKCLLAAVKIAGDINICHIIIHMAVLTGKYGSTRGTAYGIGHKTALKQHTILAIRSIFGVGATYRSLSLYALTACQA